jgi:hypothetical protein
MEVGHVDGLFRLKWKYAERVICRLLQLRDPTHHQKMIDEMLTDADRRFLLALLIEQVPAAAPPSEEVLRLISQLSGADTVVTCRRAYVSRAAK